MAKVQLINQKGEKLKDITLADSVWNIETNDIVLKKAIDYLYPYVLDPTSCPYPDLHHGSYSARIVQMMTSVNKRYKYENFEELIAPLEKDAKYNEIWRLEPIK